MNPRLQFSWFALALAACTRLEGAGLTFDSTTNGYWAVLNPSEPYAWNDPDRRRPQAGDTVRVLGHVVALRQAEQVARLELQGGELVGGAFPLTLQQDSAWSSGTVSGRLISQGALSVAGAGSKQLAGTLVNEGALKLESGASLSLGRGSVLTNPPGSSFQLGTGSTLLTSGGNAGNESLPVLALSGAFQKTGSGVATIGFGVLLQNTGTATIDSGELRCEMPYVQSAGSTRLAGSVLSSLTSISVLGGELRGSGTLRGSVLNAARLQPDAVPDSLRVEGAFAQSRAGTLALELAGPPDSGAFARLASTEVLNLRGTLELRVRAGFVPVAGSVYPVLRGTVRVGRFTETNLVEQPAGLRLVPQYRSDGMDVQVVQLETPANGTPVPRGAIDTK